MKAEADRRFDLHVLWLSNGIVKLDRFTSGWGYVVARSEVNPGKAIIDLVDGKDLEGNHVFQANYQNCIRILVREIP